MTCSGLTNDALLASLKRLVVREREAIADVVEYLAEVDARKLYIPAACASLTTYCIEVLGYSEFAAAHRVTAARLAREYPVILPMLRSGDVSLSTLRTLRPVLTASNHRERLEAAIGRTRTEVERLVAGWAPKPDVATRITPVVTEDRPVLLERMQAAVAPQVVTSQAVAPQGAQSQRQSDAVRAESVALPPTSSSPSPAASAPRPAPLPKPLTPERYSVQLTVDRETYESIMKLRDHLRHTIPDGDVAKIVARAVKDLRASVEARKFGKRKASKVKAAAARTQSSTSKVATTEALTCSEQTNEVVAPTSEVLSSSSDARLPTAKVSPIGEVRSTSGPQQSELFSEPVIEDDIRMPRAPGLATRRAIAERDHYQCCYVSDDGRRCSSTAWLEYDHNLEWALHGPTWAENMQLLCRAHHRAKHSSTSSA